MLLGFLVQLFSGKAQKSEFDKFMADKGKEALGYFKNNNENKKKLDEELHKYCFVNTLF